MGWNGIIRVKKKAREGFTGVHTEKCFFFHPDFRAANAAHRRLRNFTESAGSRRFAGSGMIFHPNTAGEEFHLALKT